VTKKVKKFPDPLIFTCKGGFLMRVSDSSVGGGAGQFQTTRWALVMASAQRPSQSVSLALHDALSLAEGRLKP
jgi:hypothetical protein